MRRAIGPVTCSASGERYHSQWRKLLLRRTSDAACSIGSNQKGCRGEDAIHALGMLCS